MTRWGKFTLAGLGLVGAGSVLSGALGSAAWKRKTAQLIGRLLPPNHREEARTVSFRDAARTRRAVEAVLRQGANGQ